MGRKEKRKEKKYTNEGGGVEGVWRGCDGGVMCVRNYNKDEFI
jgi:hypothetical protein